MNSFISLLARTVLLHGGSSFAFLLDFDVGKDGLLEVVAGDTESLHPRNNRRAGDPLDGSLCLLEELSPSFVDDLNNFRNIAVTFSFDRDDILSKAVLFLKMYANSTIRILNKVKSTSE